MVPPPQDRLPPGAVGTGHVPRGTLPGVVAAPAAADAFAAHGEDAAGGVEGGAGAAGAPQGRWMRVEKLGLLSFDLAPMPYLHKSKAMSQSLESNVKPEDYPNHNGTMLGGNLRYKGRDRASSLSRGGVVVERFWCGS